MKQDRFGHGAGRTRQLLTLVATLLVMALLPPNPANGAVGEVERVLTLDGAVALGLERNGGLKASRAALDASVWDKRASLLAYLPTGSLSSSLTRVDDSSLAQANQSRAGFIGLIDGINDLAEEFLGETAIDPFEIDPFLYRDTYRTSLSVNQEFPLNLHLVAQNRLSGAGARLAKQNHIAERDALILSIKQAYFQLLAARELVGVAEQGLASADNRRLLAVERESLGLINRAERMRWDVTLAEARSFMTDAETVEILSEMELNRLLDQPLETALAAEPVDTRTMERASELALLTPRDLADRVIAEGAAATALLEVGKAGEAGKLLGLSGLVPSLHFSFNYGWRENDTAALDDYRSWSATALLRVPLFDLAGNTARYRMAAAEQRRAGYEVSDALASLRLGAYAAWHEVARAAENLEHRVTAEREAEETFALMTDRHDMGQTSEFDLVDVQTALTAARAKAVRARYNHLTALATLESLIGSSSEDAMRQGE